MEIEFIINLREGPQGRVEDAVSQVGKKKLKMEVMMYRTIEKMPWISQQIPYKNISTLFFLKVQKTSNDFDPTYEKKTKQNNNHYHDLD